MVAAGAASNYPGINNDEILVWRVGNRGDSNNSSSSSSNNNNLEISIAMNTGEATISIDDRPWFDVAGGTNMRVVGWNDGNTSLRLVSTSITEERTTKGYRNNAPVFGSIYTNVTLVWSSSGQHHPNDENDDITSNINNNGNSSSNNSEEEFEENILHTTFLIFQEREIIVFEQYFETGWVAPIERQSNHGASENDGTPGAIVAGFPSVFLDLPRKDLGFLWWGGCFAAETFAGDWNNVVVGGDKGSRNKSTTREENAARLGEKQQDQQQKQQQKKRIDHDYTHWFDGNEHGQPWVLHDETGRTIVWSSLDNFFVSGFAARSGNCDELNHQHGTINNNTHNDETSDTIDDNDDDCPILDSGLRTTLSSIPRGHKHATILVGGSGINATMMEWGDVLLETTGNVRKERSSVYEDFSLSHLGYWTDNGAYHYNGAKEDDRYPTMEDALMGVKDGMKEKGIPIRYIQWDDWWMEKNNDFPGMISWNPKPDVFPSGFSDWLGIPLAMYAPAYFADNVWREDYSWKVDPIKNTSIPTDPRFYMDLFNNGTSIGMRMFEQDFLCSLPWAIGSTSLTTQDVDTGRNWFSDMDSAAKFYGIQLQFCMADVYHVLQATSLESVTNARATGDNTRDVATIFSMGQNSLLFYATGIYASRDNVWTSDASMEQKGCGNKDFCYEPNAPLDNAVAVLSGGPYGIADGLSFVNATLVHRSCRSDGLLLRPRWPLASLDFTFTDSDAKGSLVWAAHDDHGGSLRWSYVIGVGLEKEIAITPKRLLQGFPPPPSGKMLAWEVVLGEPVTNSTIVFSDSSPLILPQSKPLDLPYATDSPSHTHYATAPVLPNGMALLGEVAKWSTMSFGRVVGSTMEATEDSFAIELHGAPSEVAVFAYALNALTTVGPPEIKELQCCFPSSCPTTDPHGNAYCRRQLFCHKGDGCTCLDLLGDENTVIRVSELARE